MQSIDGVQRVGGVEGAEDVHSLEDAEDADGTEDAEGAECKRCRVQNAGYRGNGSEY